MEKKKKDWLVKSLDRKPAPIEVVNGHENRQFVLKVKSTICSYVNLI